MNKSFSKLRHIIESNQILENRKLFILEEANVSEVTIEDFLNAFDEIIVPRLKGLDEKLVEQGIDCKDMGKGFEDCDNKNFGFKDMFGGLFKGKRRYYFPYPKDLNILCSEEVVSADERYPVFKVKDEVFGQDAKTKQDVIDAANDALDYFIEQCIQEFSDIFPEG